MPNGKAGPPPPGTGLSCVPFPIARNLLSCRRPNRRWGDVLARKDKIFINYRRADAGGYAGRLSDSLADYFGPQRVFRDVTGIEFGHDFERVIDEKLEESGALVVMIGDRWAGATDDDGRRRLDDPEDYVVRKIAAALKADVPVVPVLIGDATMPRVSELPASIAGLARRNAMSISDERWPGDVDRLAEVIAIDVPGTVAQRRLDRWRALALALLVAASLLSTFALTRALPAALAGQSLRAAGFVPIVSALPFIAIALAGALTLNATPLMEPRGRRYAWASIGLAIVSTIGTFIAYAVHNVADPGGSLIVNFAVGNATAIATIGLLALAGFRSDR